MTNNERKKLIDTIMVESWKIARDSILGDKNYAAAMLINDAATELKQDILNEEQKER